MKLEEINITSINTSKRFGDWREFVKIPCPICGHIGHCMINPVTKQICCTRVTSNVSMGSAGYIFNLDGAKKQLKVNVSHTTEVRQAKLADKKHLNAVYRVLLKHGLQSRHFNNGWEDLKRRGISTTTINQRMIASVSLLYFESIPKRLLSKIEMTNYDNAHYTMINNRSFKLNYEKWFSDAGLPTDAWQGVPGFYLWPHQEFINEENKEIKKTETPVFGIAQSKNNKQCLGFDLPEQENAPVISSVVNSDYYIPVTDIDNNIVGMQIRHLSDDANAKYTWVSSHGKLDGCSSGAPVNVVLTPELEAKRDTKVVNNWLHNGKKSVIVTEGILKSICTAEYLPKAYTSKELKELGAVVLGNGGVSQWQKFLPLLKDLHATQVTIAYDMDYKGKQQVNLARNELIMGLIQAGYHVKLASWQMRYNGKKCKGIDDALQAGQRLSLLTVKSDTVMLADGTVTNFDEMLKLVKSNIVNKKVKIAFNNRFDDDYSKVIGSTNVKASKAEVIDKARHLLTKRLKNSGLQIQQINWNTDKKGIDAIVANARLFF